MGRQMVKIPISGIILDEKIYPRERIDQKRVGIFGENIRDGFQFDPIEVELWSEKKGKYRILDAAHRWSAYKAAGVKEVQAVVIKDLAGIDPLRYTATRAIGPRQLNEEETKNKVRRAFQNNPRLTSFEIGMAIGRSRRTVRAATEMELHIKLLRMRRLGIPQKTFVQ